jgi:hypothetical protein
MKKIMLVFFIMLLFPTYCLAQAEGSFAIVEWNANKIVVLDFSGNVLLEKDFNGIGVCYFISPSLGGWLVKGCLNYGCQGEDWILWQLQPDGFISHTIKGLGPGPFYTGITSGNFITGNVYTGIISLRNENGTVIDSINVWEEENGWPFDYNRLGDTAGLVSGGFVVPPEGGWPRSSASYAPYLYYYDENLNLINKVDISSENIRLFNLIGVASGGFAGICSDYGSSESVESLCWFDAEGSLIEKIDVTGDLPNKGYMNYFIAGLSDGRVMLTVYGHDKVWMYDPPSEVSGLSSIETENAGQMAANYPIVLDLSRSGISAIGAIAGNTFVIDSDTDGTPNVVDNCPNETNPNQDDSDGNGIGDVCDEPTSPTITIIGEYSCVPNPCTSDPCLPGMVWSVVNNDTTYHLTKKGEWKWGCEPTSWNGIIPKEGDIITVVGQVVEETDLRGYPYSNLEVEYLLPGICPVEIIYGTDSIETQLLRSLRDNVLSKTQEGQELIKLYYLWSPIVLKAMEGNEALKEKVKEAIDEMLPVIEGVRH